MQAMRFLQQAIRLRGYAQRDPLVEYKLEGYDLFLGMMAQVGDCPLADLHAPGHAQACLWLMADVRLHTVCSCVLGPAITAEGCAHRRIICSLAFAS